MEIEVRERDGVVVFGVAEPLEIDASNVDAFTAAALEAIGDTKRIVLDASRIEFFDSAGWGGLIALRNRVDERDGRLVIAGLNRAVQDVFRMIGFDVLFLTFPDAEAAVRDLGAGS